MPETVALIQARMSSSRLPGKVLAELGGKPMICFMVDRVARAQSVDQIAVVTSEDPSDDVLVETLAAHGVETIRGPLDDVLARYALAAERFSATTFLRLTGDCPLIDPQLIDQVVELKRARGLDYASNIDPPGFADGMDIECFSREALFRAHVQAQKQPEREHVTLWMREAENELERANLPSAFPSQNLRLTVDYADDLEVARRIVNALGRAFDYFDILRFLQHNRDVLGMNIHGRNEALKT